MTTNQTVWVAIATYDDEVPPICAVAITAQEAGEQLDNVIADQENPDGWIAHPPVERPVLPVDATPRGVEAWKAAGIAEGDIDEWFNNKVDEIRECAKELAHDEASGMTAADFREDFLFDVDDDEDTLSITKQIWDALPDDVRRNMLVEYINANMNLDEAPDVIEAQATRELLSMGYELLRDHLRNAVGYEAPLAKGVK